MCIRFHYIIRDNSPIHLTKSCEILFDLRFSQRGLRRVIVLGCGAVKMGAVSFSETSVSFYQPTRHQITEGSTPHSSRCEYLKCSIKRIVCDVGTKYLNIINSSWSENQRISTFQRPSLPTSSGSSVSISLNGIFLLQVNRRSQ
jgi:hypothetical protein